MPQKANAKRAQFRKSRVALIAVVALFGLAGIQEPAIRAPFGTATIAEEYGPLVDIWKNLREQMVADEETVAACLQDGVPDCAAAAVLLRIIGDAKAHRGKALIGHINRAINLLIRPTPGAWASALEVLTFADDVLDLGQNSANKPRPKLRMIAR